MTGTSPDVRSGSGTFVGISVLASALRTAGHRVEILAPEPGRGGVSFARRILFNLGAGRRVAAERGRSARSKTARQGANETEPIDAIVGFDLDGVFVRPGAARFAVAVKGEIADEARFERGAARLRLSIEARLERRNVLRADVVLATSRYSRTRIEEDYGAASTRIRIVPEPIDLARWDAALASAAPPPLSPVRPEGANILCVAHLYPRKDVATLLRAVAKLPAATLRVAGDGPELPRLRGLAGALGLGERVELLGHVSFDRLAAEFRRADVFCLPSRQEGFGIVFLEAMAAGLAIVAARAGAVPETVPDGECGILVPPGDAEALAEALKRLLGDAALRREMGKAGRERVRDYDAPLVAVRFLEALEL